MGAKQFRSSGAELPRHVGIDGLASLAIHPNAEDDELLKMQVVVNVNFTQAQLPSDVVRLCGKRGGCNL